jgi:hypothetical protein
MIGDAWIAAISAFMSATGRWGHLVMTLSHPF